MCACDSHKAFSLLSLVKSNSDTTQKSLNSWKKNAQPNCSEWIFHWGRAQILNMAPEPDQNSFIVTEMWPFTTQNHTAQKCLPFGEVGKTYILVTSHQRSPKLIIQMSFLIKRRAIFSSPFIHHSGGILHCFPRMIFAARTFCITRTGHKCTRSRGKKRKKEEEHNKQTHKNKHICCALCCWEQQQDVTAERGRKNTSDMWCTVLSLKLRFIDVTNTSMSKKWKLK